jgi:hypothetical protein
MRYENMLMIPYAMTVAPISRYLKINMRMNNRPVLANGIAID